MHLLVNISANNVIDSIIMCNHNYMDCISHFEVFFSFLVHCVLINIVKLLLIINWFCVTLVVLYILLHYCFNYVVYTIGLL